MMLDETRRLLERLPLGEADNMSLRAQVDRERDDAVRGERRALAAELRALMTTGGVYEVLEPDVIVRAIAEWIEALHSPPRPRAH